MSSLWKDLLFLHGYLVRKEDLDWRCDTLVEADPDKTDAMKKPHSLASTCCVAVWPRLAGPR